MSNEFFFSASTGFYVARQPLRIDERVDKAAVECGLELYWDDEGRINMIPFEEACLLLQYLKATMMSPAQYWQVLRDAQGAGDSEMVKELTSCDYTEWLGAIFEGPNIMTENPRVAKSENGGYQFIGLRKKVEMPFGRPGWLDLKDIEPKNGLPIKVTSDREKYSVAWKYWSVAHTAEMPVAPIRGYVTSAGKPSLDLDIPTIARQPRLMIRECRQEPLEPTIPAIVLEQAEQFASLYNALNSREHYRQLLKECEPDFINFLNQFGFHFWESREIDVYRLREKFIDMLGVLLLASMRRGRNEEMEMIRFAAKKFISLERPISDDSFNEFMLTSRSRLERAVKERSLIIFVVGHKNPDTDTAVSSLIEAYRNYLTDNSAAYIPILQSKRAPDEVRRLLGEEAANAFMLDDEDLYKQAAASGRARWILVDHNKSERQKFSIAIIDHHIPCQVALRQRAAKSLQMTGSCAALIAQKYFGLGLEIPPNLARIMLGACLMDTENRARAKMLKKDYWIMDDLKKASGVSDESVFYRDLMGFLLNTNDEELLFARDYKEDWGLWGFAVAKVKNGFDDKGNLLKASLVNRLLDLADKNNKKKNFPLTVIKFVDYKDEEKIVNRERFYLVWGKDVQPEFKRTVIDLVVKIIRLRLGKQTQIRVVGVDYIEFWNGNTQLSRKKIAPLLELVIAAFTRYFYSPSTQFYVSREFLQAKPKVQAAAETNKLALSCDGQGRVNNITFCETKKLFEKLGLKILTLPQYWQVLQDALIANDAQMAQHLRSEGFIEFLDTVIEDRQFLINNSVVTKDGYEGFRESVSIPIAEPGLIKAESIDLKTGLPVKVLPPENFDDRTLWRYWSPDAFHTVATRSHIFLINQPSLDLKLHPGEAMPNLGARPCRESLELPDIEIYENQDYLKIIIKQDGEIVEIRSDQLMVS